MVYNKLLNNSTMELDRHVKMPRIYKKNKNLFILVFITN